jgi:hypothetical protein
MEPNCIVAPMAPAGEGGTMPYASDGETPVERKAAAPDDGAHKRSAHRQRTLKQAKILLTDWTTIDCTVRDISEGGAHLVFGDAFVPPEEFRLMLISSNTIVPVRLLWQRGLNVGVAFTGPQEPAPARK